MQKVNISRKTDEIHIISGKERRELESIQKIMAELIDTYDGAADPESSTSCQDIEELRSRMEPVMARMRIASTVMIGVLYNCPAVGVTVTDFEQKGGTDTCRESM